jgi:hypothetical protein
VLGLCALVADRWGPIGRSLHATFGVLMLLAAVFPARSWEAAAAFDATVDLAHSFAATAMGFAFAFGVVAVAVRRRSPAVGRVGAAVGVLDIVAVVASVVLPVGMVVLPDAAGLLQRSMFAIAYLWYGSEAVRPERVGRRRRDPVVP